jgi:hypothetical protein
MRIAMAALGLVLSGCSDSGTGGVDSGDCALTVALTGGIDADLAGSADCAIVERDDRIELYFFAAHDVLRRIDIEVEGVVLGAPAADLTSEISIVDRDGRVWSTDDCAVDLTTARDRDGVVEIAGGGDCTAPAEPWDSGGPIALTAWSFTAAAQRTGE